MSQTQLMTQNNFFVIIPARLASTRLPRKPLADLAGKPMVVRVAERAKLSGAKLVAVACDDVSIIDACEQYGITAYLTQADHQSGTDRIAEVAKKLDLPADTVIVNVQGDEPLIDPELISATAAQIKQDIEMSTAAHLITSAEDAFNPNVVKVVIDKSGRALYFSRATIPWNRDAFTLTKTSMPTGYRVYRHIGIYAYTYAFLQKYSTLELAPLECYEALEQLRVLWNGYPIAVHVAATASSTGVDTPDDLQRVRQYYSEHGNE
ncbi:MAG: 3-deoxy-manno-octulosonate cytidylyltransferase [Solimicrobium sp.]|jgi:3-deoxy-manno-octulosonate cytidylyltransferase (CMP-KDO synthetase)|nr:3-deoxy-manno-octulosonate cytidylyltransferase [Solimicrobium sp.]